MANRGQQVNYSWGRILWPDTEKMSDAFNRLIMRAWNVHRLINIKDTKRPKRRTAIECRDLSSFNFDGSTYTTFCNGKEGRNEKRKRTTHPWKKSREDKTPHVAISERLMTLRVPLNHGSLVILIYIYVLTLVSDDAIKQIFRDLFELVNANQPSTGKKPWFLATSTPMMSVIRVFSFAII